MNYDEYLIIEWEYDQAGFIVHEVKAVSKEEADKACDVDYSRYDNLTILKCLAPSAEIIQYFDDLDSYEYHDVMVDLTYLQGYSDDIEPEMFGLQSYGEEE